MTLPDLLVEFVLRSTGSILASATMNLRCAVLGLSLETVLFDVVPELLCDLCAWKRCRSEECREICFKFNWFV